MRSTLVPSWIRGNGSRTLISGVQIIFKSINYALCSRNCGIPLDKFETCEDTKKFSTISSVVDKWPKRSDSFWNVLSFESFPRALHHFERSNLVFCLKCWQFPPLFLFYVHPFFFSPSLFQPQILGDVHIFETVLFVMRKRVKRRDVFVYIPSWWFVAPEITPSFIEIITHLLVVLQYVFRLGFSFSSLRINSPGFTGCISTLFSVTPEAIKPTWNKSSGED